MQRNSKLTHIFWYFIFSESHILHIFGIFLSQNFLSELNILNVHSKVWKKTSFIFQIHMTNRYEPSEVLFTCMYLSDFFFTYSSENHWKISDSLKIQCMVHLSLSSTSSWEDKQFFSFILDEVLAINNKRNQLKIKGIKVYSSKQ